MTAVKLRIIEEVRKRPFLWDFQNRRRRRKQEKDVIAWTEIGKKVGVDGTTCKTVWRQLRAQFCNEAHHIPKRIAKAKQKGEFDPNKKYYSWAFFDALRFVANGRSARAKFDLSFENNSDMEIVENNNVDQMESQFFDRSSYQTECDDDIEIVECDNSGHMKSEMQKYFENNYASDNDIDSPSSVIPVDDCDGSNPEDTNFRSYTFSLNSCVSDNEYPTASNRIDNTALPSCSFKEDPELQIDPEMHISENTNELQENTIELQERRSTISAVELSNSSESSNLLVESGAIEHHDPEDRISNQRRIDDEEHGHNRPSSTFPEKHNSNPPDLNDEDYSFLCSFLSHTKVMTQLQNKEFRVNMKKLLMDIFPASASVNILEKQLLLPEDSDLDRKFLISFWPFLKSMSLTQNVQFRTKMANLVLKILLSETIL